MAGSFEIMDSQRFDMTLKQKLSRRSLSIITEASSADGVSESSSELPSPMHPGAWIERLLPKHRPTLPTPPSSDDDHSSSDPSDDTSSSSSSADATAQSTPPVDSLSESSGSLIPDAVSINNAFPAHPILDGEDYVGHTTTCTIIRPIPKEPILGFLPSPLFSRPSSPTSPGSSSFSLSALNCFSNAAGNFEDDVDLFQERRSKEQAGVAGVRVWVKEEVIEQREETWRDAIQEVVYGNINEDAMRRTRVVSITRD